jgi:hypothetical protein
VRKSPQGGNPDDPRGIEMENVMYERIPLKVKFLDGKGNLEMSLGEGLRLPSPWVHAENVCTCARHKKNQVCL